MKDRTQILDKRTVLINQMDYQTKLMSKLLFQTSAKGIEIQAEMDIIEFKLDMIEWVLNYNYGK